LRVHSLSPRPWAAGWADRSTGSWGQSQNVDRSEGSTQEAGRAFGKKEQAEEERYFRAQAREQLAALKKHHEGKLGHHKGETELSICRKKLSGTSRR
uniref:ATPase inhibitor, mitochondrial n=1 Tax=Prolemur simus TaxID=1328070 RepID=A0A8C9B071_PROSS